MKKNRFFYEFTAVKEIEEERSLPVYKKASFIDKIFNRSSLIKDNGNYYKQVGMQNEVVTSQESTIKMYCGLNNIKAMQHTDDKGNIYVDRFMIYDNFDNNHYIVKGSYKKFINTLEDYYTSKTTIQGFK